MAQRRRERRIFLAEPPRREKLSHRPPHTIVHALSKFELHWFLLCCVRVWGMLGPNLTLTCPTEAPRKFHFAHFSTNCRVNRRKSYDRQDLLKLYQVVYPILAGGGRALRREKLSQRPPHTVVHALSKFELHWCLLRCVRVWGMLGPNLTRTCPTEVPWKFNFAYLTTNCHVN